MKPGRSPSVLAVVLVALAWGGAAALARLQGFDVLSDDDDARVFIAQRFAAHASLDPSGTSWLPLPFWSMGLAMKLASPTLAVARGVAIMQATAAGMLVFAAARAAGLARQSAVFAALVPLLSPLVPLLGAAPTPELLGAALALYGVVAMTGDRPALGGAALLAATLSRYETWAPALLAASLALLRWWTAEDRRERAQGLAGAALSLLGPVAWSLWNVHAHGSAFHYASRVASYQAALGAHLPALSYLSAMARFAPVPLAGFVLGLLLLGRRGLRRTWVLAACIAALVVGLVVSAARGGAPTHHPERALCLAWMAASIGFVATLPELLVARSRLRALAFVLCAVGLGIAARRLVARDLAGLPDRSAERALGGALARAVPPGEKVLLVPSSYAHLATLTSFGRPGDAVVLPQRSYDPRASTGVDPTSDPELLRAACHAHGARYAVLSNVAALAHAGAYAETWLLPGGVLARVELGSTDPWARST